jgi:S1-C subfamily serine protease
VEENMKLALFMMALVIPNNMTTLVDCSVKIHVVLLSTKHEGFGSGVYIAPNLILTANHLYSLNAKFYIDEDHKIEATVVKQDAKNDLMLLRVEGKHKFVKLGSMPDELDNVITIAYPLGVAKMALRGVVTIVSNERLLIDSRVIRGMSGGGVFSQDGRLIAICVGAWGDQDQQLMMAIALPTIRNFVKGVK